MVIAGCLVGSGAAAQEVPTDYTVPEGVTVLSEQELRIKIVGNTMIGFDYGKKWAEYFAEDGTIMGTWGPDRYRGKWTIAGPVMCFDYPGTYDDECNTIALDGNIWLTFVLDGSPSKFPTGELLEGNPRKF